MSNMMSLLGNMKLKSKMILLSSIICGAVLVIGVIITLVLEQQKDNLKQGMSQSLARSSAIVAFTHAAKDISLDVIQVQQWLTDISATRALDGLNDGFDEAENFAQKFEIDVATALKISRELQLDKLVTTLNKINAAFPPYYETGAKMAQSYIDDGPAGGNKMMAQFDEAAERINIVVADLLALSEQELKKQDSLMRDNLGSVSTSLTMVENLNVIGILIILFISIVSVFLIQKIVGRPLSILNVLMLRLADGEDDVDLPKLGRQDEIGEMTDTLQIFQDKSLENKRLAEETRIAAEKQQKAEQIIQKKEEEQHQRKLQREQADQAERDARSENISALITGFDNKISEMLRVLSSAAVEMSTAANQVVGTSQETKRQSTSVATDSEETADSVQKVTSAAEKLSISVQEISKQVQTANAISEQAVHEAGESETAIKALADSAGRISQVISLINDIAEQTNLLALNATIESARAGEAGKGFAVVANEVKALAGQTAKATDEISSQITEMQSLMETAVKCIDTILTVNKKSNETTAGIASAVEEQNVATKEVSYNIQMVATGTEKMSSNISNVARGAEETGTAGDQVLSVSTELKQVAETLKNDVEQFLNEVRTV